MIANLKSHPTARFLFNLLLIGGLLLTACDGTITLNSNLDEDGSGTITIDGAGEGSEPGQDGEQDNQSAVAIDQTVLIIAVLGFFTLIVALIIGLNRRSSTTYVVEDAPRRERVIRETERD